MLTAKISCLVEVSKKERHRESLQGRILSKILSYNISITSLESKVLVFPPQHTEEGRTCSNIVNIKPNMTLTVGGFNF